MRRVESIGSIWELDDELSCYRRWPKQEAPRERPEWSDERAGPLQDFVWHPMIGWGVLRWRPTVVIGIEGDAVLTAPIAPAIWQALLTEGRVWEA